MTDAERIAEYRNAVHACTLVADLLRAHDLPALLQHIERAHALGPMIDPTLYRAKAPAMLEDAEVLTAALPLWELGRKLERLRAGRQGSG